MNSAQEAPNIDDHLSPNLNSNMNLLFYNFNNSRAQTAVGGKRAPSLGVEPDRSFYIDDQSKPPEKLEKQMMYSTDAFSRMKGT